MFAHSINYRQRDGAASSGGRVSRGFWLHGVPRPLILCRLIGHDPVVDGTTGRGDGDRGSRWVVCDRCGVRPDPQGSLNPLRWNIGDQYPLAWESDDLPTDERARFAALKALKDVHYGPGRWPGKPTGTLGGQIVLGSRRPQLGFGFKVGNKGSEHTLATDLHLPWIGSLYLHTERFGAGLVRRLNPTGYHSRVVEIEIRHGRLSWKLWAKRDEWSRHDPRWMQGSLLVDPRVWLLGERRYSYDNRGAAVTETVRMPHGDRHPVTLQLQRCTLGRKRGAKKLSWSVDWNAARGIPTKPTDRGRIFASGVTVTDAAVAAGVWHIEAATRIAADMTAMRVGEDWPAPADTSVAG